MKKFKFCANLDFLFLDHGNLLTRYSQAQKFGFVGVETANPYKFPPGEIASVLEKCDLSQVMINTPRDEAGEGEYGHACIPGKEKQFRDGFAQSLVYASTLNSKFIHIMSGCKPPKHTEVECYNTYVSNLKEAATALTKLGIHGLIEPINTCSVPNYYMNCYDKAVSVIDAVGSKNIGLLMDIYHLQTIRGNVTRSIAEYLPFIKHIQISQVPGRHEPNSPGELNYAYILVVLQMVKYQGWIGLEYHPARGTEDGLNWILECCPMR